MQNRAKFCMFWPMKFILGWAPKILDRHYETRPSTDHRAKFHADQPTHLGDRTFFAERGKSCSRLGICPVLNIFILLKDIHSRILNLTEIAQNFACF